MEPGEKSNEVRVTKKALNPYAGVALGTFVGSMFFLGGYLLTRGNQESFASVMFLLVPFVSGFAIAAVVRPVKLLIACCVMTCILSLSVLIETGLEGYICCFMAFPLMAVGVAIGAVVGYLVRGQFLDVSQRAVRNKVILLAMAPILITTANRLEKPLRVEREETFVTTIEVTATPEETWKHLVQMQSMDGTKPLLLRIGLPVPEHCTLDQESVGGRRICYFDQGIIGQEVMEWDEPRAMGVKTTESTLPGRHWLKFLDAGYQLKATPTGTLVERRTTIGSRLYPRWYWRPFERWGVESEHEFVLTSIKKAAEESQ